MLFKKPLHMVVHDGSFHPDDVMACAIIKEYCTQSGKKLKITRTRDASIQAKANIVADTGNVYDPELNRFDHHQKEGAGTRENGIPYASAGLVWKHFGLEISGSDSYVWEAIEYGVMQSLDGADNGFSTVTLKEGFPAPYFYGDALLSFRPAYGEVADMNVQFLKAVDYAHTILLREIAIARGASLSNKKILDAYNKQEDKTLLVLEEPFSREDVNRAFAIHTMPESLLVVFPTGDEITGMIDDWKLLTIRAGLDIFVPRLKLPAAWGGLVDEQLQKVTGVSDAVFCHRGLFMAVAKSREGALKLAKLALVK